MPDQRTIIVGGGLQATSTAYKHALAGARDDVLLERNDLAQGTTTAGAGFIATWAAGNIPAWRGEELAFERYAIDFYRRLSAAGHDLALHDNGHLWIATNDDAFEEHIQPMIHDDSVPDSRVVDPAGIERLLGGLVPAAGVVGGVFHPNCVYLSAPKAARALAAAFEQMGGEVRTRWPVDELIVDDGRILGVRGQHGDLRGHHVILCLGAWTNALLRRHDAWLPIAPVTATRIITEPLGVAPTTPSFLLPELEQLWIREEAGGLLWGGNYEARPHYDFVDADPPDRFVELPLDGYEETLELGRRAAAVVPLLGQYRSATIAHGAPVMTPDFRPIAGRVPGFDGLWAITGDCECGVTHGPGLGRTVAELVLGGAPTLDVDPAALDPGRFDSTLTSGADVLKAMANAEGGVWKLQEVAAPPPAAA
jgi:glycine/D-amino acid oxidase-like deaminating enzyme